MADIVDDGMTKVAFVPTIADTSAPTTAELNAGEDLETFITPDGLGLEYGNDSVDTTALSSTFGASAPGRQTVSGELTLKDQGRGEVPWSTFAAKVEGYIVVRRHLAVATAWTSAQKVEVYTIQAGTRKPVSPAANELSRFGVGLFHTAAPVLDAAVA